jgi:signal transduction histidine kinase/ActR/RegA family two-component response regulator
VLVVDDDPWTLGVLVDLLHREGVRSLTASSAEQALELVENVVPRLALIDVVMPGMGGLALCRRLKDDPRTAGIPVVLVTGRVYAEDVDAGMAAGAIDYIKKPFDRSEARFRIRTHLRLQDAIQKQRIYEKNLLGILETLPVGIAIVGNDRRVRWTNRATQQLACASGPNDLTGQPCNDVLCGAPDGKCPILDLGETIEKVEMTFPRADGSSVPVLKSVHEVEFDGHIALLEVFVDLRKRKQLEIELGHARKLEAVGQLAAGIAHEINTPTQYVGDSVQFLKEAFDGLQRLMVKYRETIASLVGAGSALSEEIAALETEVDLDYLQENIPGAFNDCIGGISRIANIVRAMKEFAHPDQREQSLADINQALLNTLTIARNEYKSVADAESDLAELPQIMCHLGDLNQVFLNLIVNAGHAIAEAEQGTGARGKILLKTALEGDFVRIEVSDTGAGIAASIRDRVFDPFFTTKPVGKGTGQGLAIARSIVVDRHRGTLTFDSTVGAGTTFTVRLPVGGAPVSERGAR